MNKKHQGEQRRATLESMVFAQCTHDIEHRRDKKPFDLQAPKLLKFDLKLERDGEGKNFTNWPF